MRHLLVCSLLFLAGCEIESGLPSVESIAIAEGNPAQRVTTQTVVIETEAYRGDAEADGLSGARIFVGDTFEVTGTTYDGEPLGRRFVYEATSSCESLPQGDGLTARYEMRNEDGGVLQAASVTVDIDTCD